MIRKHPFRLFFILFSLSVCGCSSDRNVPADDSRFTEVMQSREESISITDDLGREVTLERPQRVAALIGSFADIWCLAGGKESLAAAANDTWTSFDLNLDDSVRNLGTIKSPNLEVLFASEPDLILASCNTAANLQLLDTFTDAGIPVLYFDVSSFEDYLRMLEACTKLTGREDCLQVYGTSVRQQVELAISRQTGETPRVLCIRAAGSGCRVKGSDGNVLGEMLADLGCVNVADSDKSSLEQLSLEAILSADPDYIFAVLQGADKEESRAVLEQTLLSNPAWQNLRAVKEGNFYTLDHTLYNLKPNARWGEAYEKLADILYPQ